MGNGEWGIPKSKLTTPINYEKNSPRSALTDLSLEGILHSKQFDMVTKFKEG